jgi:hypothetical protein
MAEPNSAAAPAIHTNIESGNFDEKAAHHHNTEPAPAHKPKMEDKEEEDEDIDALIEDLESQDGGDDEEEEEETQGAGMGRSIPEEMLQTDTRLGLTEGKPLLWPDYIRACHQQDELYTGVASRHVVDLVVICTLANCCAQPRSPTAAASMVSIR